MLKQFLVMAGVLAFATRLVAEEPGVLARFEGGIGVIPVSSAAAPANPDGTFQNAVKNVVRGVNPGAGPWRIADLKATVLADGRIKVRGRGLLLASGNRIGQNGSQSVFATLICEAAAPFVERSSTLQGVALAENGDFRIDDVLSSVPADCPSPLLLIRNRGGAWFAAGILTVDHDD
jgi:hypothetical protein